MTRKTATRIRRRPSVESAAVHLPHWSWTRRNPDPRGDTAVLAPEDFWSRLGL